MEPKQKFPNSVIGRIVARERKEVKRKAFWGNSYDQGYSKYTEVRTPDHSQSDHWDVAGRGSFNNKRKLPAYKFN